MKGDVSPYLIRTRRAMSMKGPMTKCYGCGAPKTDRDCDECGIIACDGCAHFAGMFCERPRENCYTPDVVAGAAAIVREAARRAVRT